MLSYSRQSRRQLLAKFVRAMKIQLAQPVIAPPKPGIKPAAPPSKPSTPKRDPFNPPRPVVDPKPKAGLDNTDKK